MGEVATAAVIMAGMGLLFGTILATAYQFLRVEEDPRLDDVEEMLPGTNCGACGTPGCRAFAEAVLAGELQAAKCTVSGPEEKEQIAAYLGVDAGEAEQRVARLKCAGEQGLVGEVAAYRGIASCRAAVIVSRGGRACEWGCLGLADCARACTFGAIHMTRPTASGSQGLPVVSVDKCTACNDCVEVCPLDLFVLKPVAEQLFVQCNSPLEGEAARAVCEVACDACGRCAADAPVGTVVMQGGLPVIHYEGAQQPTAEATYRCPTGAIQWLTGQQFPQDATRSQGKAHA